VLSIFKELKQLIRPVRVFKTLKTAYATIMGFGVMRALRKGQAAIFNLTQDIRGEASIVERAFGMGPGALAEAVVVISALPRKRFAAFAFRVGER
jgi:hypothetical protein